MIACADNDIIMPYRTLWDANFMRTSEFPGGITTPRDAILTGIIRVGVPFTVATQPG
jgi:hypothetical protein